MLGAHVMMVGGGGAGRIDDHLAFHRLGAEQFRRHQIDALARIVLGIEHRLARPVHHAKARRIFCENRIEADGVGNFAIEQNGAAER